jgi:hypothetical protein
MINIEFALYGPIRARHPSDLSQGLFTKRTHLGHRASDRICAPH